MAERFERLGGNMNETLLIIKMLFAFSSILLALRLFGKAGMYAWIAVASILANIIVAKNIEVFGIDATMGNVMFASTFLATDIISEKYGAKAARKGVYIGLFSVLLYLVISQFCLRFMPSEMDMVHGSMVGLFTLAPRICLASVSMYFLANLLDVVLYDALRKRFDGKRMWLRNNICTIICNSIENFGFVVLAFAGVYPVEELLIIAISTSVIEAAIAVCDTTFLYLAKKVQPIGKD